MKGMVELILANHDAKNTICQPSPTKYELANLGYNKHNLLARALLTRHIPTTIQSLIQHYQSAHLIWTDLLELHEGTSVSRTMNTFRDYFAKVNQRTNEDLGRIFITMTLPQSFYSPWTVITSQTFLWTEIKQKVIELDNQLKLAKTAGQIVQIKINAFQHHPNKITGTSPKPNNHQLAVKSQGQTNSSGPDTTSFI